MTNFLSGLRRLAGRKTPPLPVPFIVGVPRSGTTLLRLMLDAHPQLAIPAETHFMPELIKLWRQWRNEGADEAVRRERVVEFLTGHHRWDDWPVSEAEIRAELEREPLWLHQAVRCVHLAYAKHRGKPRWGDKTPTYLMRMKPLQKAVPEARFIHIIRDGRDVAVSLADLSWGPVSTERAAEQWVRKIGQARERAGELLPDSYIEVRYEDLVTDPAPTLQRICAFIDLEWDPAILDYHHDAGDRIAEWGRDLERRKGGVISAEERASQHRFAASPPTTQRIGRWRTGMPAEDQQRFEAIAGELLDEFGYERTSDQPGD